nr:unnamed protein product [Digitaria exilis]
MDPLPEDVLADVLSLLPPRALAVSRAVCKAWRAVADADARCQLRTDLLPVTVGGVFIMKNEPEDPAFFARPSMAHRIAGDVGWYLRKAGFFADVPWVVDCCNGLLLLDDADQVVNPATKQWACLPPCPILRRADGYHYKFLVFDPMVSPHYQVLAMRGPPDGKDELSEQGLEWPPSVYKVCVYSSSTGTWEQRPFILEEGTPRTAADVLPRLDPARQHAAYWDGKLYVYWVDVITRITLSSDKYQVINLPTGIDANSSYYHLRLGKSRNGVHFVVVDDQNRLQVWFLAELAGKTEWVLKHSASLEALKFSRSTDRPWVVQHGNYDRRSNREPVLEKEMDWDSDDENAVDVEEWGKKHSCLYIEVLGFHPYREIVFLFMQCGAVAYYFDSSKVQDLGDVRIRHMYQVISEAFIYTPCWVGELSGNN